MKYKILHVFEAIFQFNKEPGFKKNVLFLGKLNSSKPIFFFFFSKYKKAKKGQKLPPNNNFPAMSFPNSAFSSLYKELKS